MQNIQHFKKTIKFNSIKGVEQECTFYYVIMNDFSLVRWFLEKHFIKIYVGDKKYDIKTAKNRLLNYLNPKSKSQQIGSVAEFFTHLFLISVEFEQEFLFSNLEEGSCKKGFDGLFTKDDDYWLVESKSGYTMGVIRENNIEKAIVDITKKVEGNGGNNPFDNAANHIRNVREHYDKALYDIVLDLSLEYQKGVFHCIDEFNIIPVSTIFINHGQSIEEASIGIKRILERKLFKAVIVICIDNTIFEAFIEYLKE